MAEYHVLAAGEVRQARHSSGEPLAVGMLSCKVGLDLLVADDPPFLGVDQEHFSRLQTALGNNAFRSDVDHANF